MVKFGFRNKTKKKTKADKWQEDSRRYYADKHYRESKKALGEEVELEAKQKEHQSSSYSSSSSSSASKKQAEEEQANYGVTVQRNNSTQSYPGYDPYNADEYIPATRRRSQFDSSVLAMREEEQGSMERERPRYLNYQEQERARQEQERPTSPYRKPRYTYTTDESSTSDDDWKNNVPTYKSNKAGEKDSSSKFGAPTSLSDISEDKERYFTQQERRRERPTAGLGHRITQMCDSIADGISETMSRFFNSARLFFKTCLWSGSGRRKD